MQKVIVSLTSYTKRIHVVHKVIKSLWNQKICADEIILYLSIEEFPKKTVNLPKELLEMVGIKGFHIEWVNENLKSHKKYYYALQKYSEDIVITVDDDMEYAETLLSDLLKSYEMFPNAISARRARMIQRDDEKIIAYRDWDKYYGECLSKQRMDLCAIGVGGILYPPHSALDKWFEQENILDLAKYQDDLWLKFNEIVNNIPVVYIKPSQKDVSIEGTNDDALSMSNVCNGENDICIKKLSEYMKKHNSAIFHDWFKNLMTKEEFILEKKNYYFSYLQKVFNDMKDESIYLYGAGKSAKIVLSILSDAHVLDKLGAIIVSEKQDNPKNLFGLEVKQLDELSKESKFYVIYGVGKEYQPEIEKILSDYNCIHVNLEIEELIYYYKKLYRG